MHPGRTQGTSGPFGKKVVAVTRRSSGRETTAPVSLDVGRGKKTTMTIIWTDYMKYRARLRGLDLDENRGYTDIRTGTVSGYRDWTCGGRWPAWGNVSL